MCRLYPSTFVPRCTSLLLPILHRCVPPSHTPIAPNTNGMAIRAASALGGLALGIVNWTHLAAAHPDLSDARAEISDILREFFSVPKGASAAPSPTMLAKGKMVQPEPVSQPLADALYLAISSAQNGDTSDILCSPQWATSVLAALTVLFGEGLFSSPHGTRLMLECLTVCLGRKAKTHLKLLGRLWWSSAIWAASHLDDKDEAWDRVAQIRMPPNGTAVIAVLVSRVDGDREDRVEKALTFLKRMISENHAIGIYILNQLVYSSANLDLVKEADEHPWCQLGLVCRQLLDGSVLHNDSKTLAATCDDIIKNKLIPSVLEREVKAGGPLPGIDDVRPLEFEEVRTWMNPLLHLWNLVARKVNFASSKNGQNHGEAPVSGCFSGVLYIWLTSSFSLSFLGYGSISSMLNAMPYTVRTL